MRRLAGQSVSQPGLTLAELLISLALMGFVSLSIGQFLIKTNAASSTLTDRFQENAEIQYLIKDLQQDLQQGAYISSNSHNARLEYTTYNASGSAVKKIYQIVTNSGKKYLQLSLDGGTTWISPYRISSSTRYTLLGAPAFLYAWSINNCTNFNDSTGDGVYLIGWDTGGTYQACPSGTGSPVLMSPSQSYKVDLQGFQFSTGKGLITTTRSLPPDFFISVPPGPVRSTASAVSPAVKDPPLIQKFSTATANSLFGTAFDVTGLSWDSTHEQLILVGQHSSGNHTFFITDRKGVIANTGITTATTTIQANGVAILSDNKTILLLDSTAKKVYQFDTSQTPPLAASATLDLASPTNLINTPTSIAYDPGTPTDFYLVGTDPADSGLKIFQRNQSTGALVGTAWSLPAAFTVSAPPAGLAIEPTSGDFLVVRNYVNGVSPNQTIDIYRITRSNGTSTSFSVNISELGSNATGSAGNWGIAYDPLSNQIYLSDTATDKVYQVVPGLLISPRS